MEKLPLNFAGRTFAYRRPAQGLSRSVSAFSIFVRAYLDQCAQYVDYVGIAASCATYLKWSIREVFQCIRPATLKLTFESANLESESLNF